MKKIVFSLCCTKGEAFCICPFVLHCQNPENDKQNVDFSSPPGKTSAVSNGWHASYQHYGKVQLTWVKLPEQMGKWPSLEV